MRFDDATFALSLILGASALLLVLRARLPPIDVAAWRNRLILLTISLLVTLIAAEYLTRFVFRDVTTSADNGGYFSRRWNRGGHVSVNASGFRGRPFDLAKPPGVYRVAVVGDSFTYGNGVDQQDRFTDVMQARLPEHFEVLNFGEAGANTPQHRVRVEWLLTNVQPDFILLQWYVNDVEDDDSTGRPTFHPLVPVRSLHDWLTIHSALYTVLNMRWAEMQVAFGMTTSYIDYLQHRLGDPNSASSVRDRELLRDLVSKAQKANVPIGIVLFPDTAGPLDDRYPFGYLHDRVHAVCSDRNITCLDLRSAFSTVKNKESLWANRLDHHPGPEANRIAAEQILATYSAAWAVADQHAR